MRGEPRCSDGGQAAVESALTLPLVLFLVLGLIQLFLAYQARLMTQYAASRAVTAGVKNHGNCTTMMHAATLALMPSIETYAGNRRGMGPRAQKLAEAFRERVQARPFPQYSASDGPHSGEAIFWIIREYSGGVNDDESFDETLGADRTLAVRFVYWYPLRVPFVNWVMSSMFASAYGVAAYTAQNPLLLTQQASWKQESALPGAFAAELGRRVTGKQYVMPVSVTYAMRMMTPARSQYFGTKNCPGAPQL